MTSDSVANPHSEPESEGASGQLISPAVRRKLQQCYEHATKLMKQESYDFDYAHSLLAECVTRDPGNLVYLEDFLTNLQRKYKNNKRGAVLQFGGKGGFKKALARKSWPEVLQLGPEILKNNPWDIPTLRGMADASHGMGMPEVELRYLRNALEAKPKDSAVNRHCAIALARVGRFDQAIACWQRVDEAEGGDREAQEAISDLQIAKTQSHGRALETGGALPSSATIRAKKRKKSAAREQQPRREIPLTPRQELEQTIKVNPTNIEPYFQLVDLHVEDNRLGEAVLVLTKALAASGNDLRVQERLEDIELLRKRQQLEIAERRVQNSEAADRAELVEQLKDDLNRYEIEIYDRRSQRYPEELELKFELGVRLKRAGNLRPALEQLALAEQSENWRAAARLEAGECLQRLKKYSEAMERYQAAAAAARESSQPDVLKLALYRAALLSTGLGNDRAAEELLADLVEQNPGYRDAASRLDKIRRMRHKG